MARLVEAALVAVIGGAMVLGAYQAGRRSANEWWRVELAARSEAVKEVMAKLGDGVEASDAELVRTLGGLDDKIRQAESDLANSKKPPTEPAVAVSGECRPVPAQCLRRGG